MACLLCQVWYLYNKLFVSKKFGMRTHLHQSQKNMESYGKSVSIFGDEREVFGG